MQIASAVMSPSPAANPRRFAGRARRSRRPKRVEVATNLVERVRGRHRRLAPGPGAQRARFENPASQFLTAWRTFSAPKMRWWCVTSWKARYTL